MNEEIMKKKETKPRSRRPRNADEILPEYDFSKARPNKFAAQFPSGASVIVLEPDVAEMFPTDQEVNMALRLLGTIIRSHQPPRILKRASSRAKGRTKQIAEK